MLDSKLLALNLQFFAEGGEDSTGGGDQTITNQSEGEVQIQDRHEQSTDQKTDIEKKAISSQNQENVKTFTQEEVTKIIANEAKKTQEKLLKQLGVDNFKNAKEGLAKFREWQDSQKTEQEKQAERLQELEQKFNSTSEENAVLRAQISAMKAGVKAESVEDVVVLARTLVNDEVDMDSAISKVLEKYPHFAQVVQKEQDNQDQQQKPTFSTGTHQKQEHSELDKWMAAFKLK
ncbi:hypothetical protein [Heyndrickxia ginsengihumi]|uniref:hypothetical protein n=1 Tax=Heyndrickxia ginsengihumi TaxID=363870 RepID=UPI003D2031B4